MIREAKLNTLHIFDDVNERDEDFLLWQNIAEYMNGEIALVTESALGNGSYVFLGLKNAEKDKELYYMMEQDSMTGIFIDDREGFEKAWESDKYEYDGCFYLKKENLIFEESEVE